MPLIFSGTFCMSMRHCVLKIRVFIDSYTANILEVKEIFVTFN